MMETTLDRDFQRLAATWRDPELCKSLLRRLEEILDGRPMRFMEVCGTHTVAIFQSGLRSVLPRAVTHLSGPGCPVCVTHEAEVAMFLELARREDVIVATFGDLLRVPGAGGFSLKHAQAAGARVEIVYSPLECLKLAAAWPDKKIVFLGVGFETTAPTVAATILEARKRGTGNFLVLSMHKLVPPVLRALLTESASGIDTFLLPGHVATITGLPPFEFLASEYAKPAAVAGFEPSDLLLALCRLAQAWTQGRADVVNAYARAVSENGNPRARELMSEVFEPCPASWRGLGEIAASGLRLRREFSDFDALAQLDMAPVQTAAPSGCMCGQVLKGRMQPPQCALFGKKCTPANPVGPCMVSTEGSCAAWFKYGEA